MFGIIDDGVMYCEIGFGYFMDYVVFVGFKECVECCVKLGVDFGLGLFCC